MGDRVRIQASFFLPQHRENGKRSGGGAASCFSMGRRHECGQATLEYVLLLGIIGVVALGFLRTFNLVVADNITKFNVILERELSPGSFPEKEDRVWRLTP